MIRSLILTSFLLAAFAPAPAYCRSKRIPTIRTEDEQKDPYFEQETIHKDLFSRVMHFWDGITDMEIPVNRVPGVDFFLDNFEKRVRRGIDAPLAEIALNADSAREGLRLSFNDLAKAGASPQMAKISEELRQMAEELTPLLERNRAAIRQLESLAQQGRSTVGVMVYEPPQSPGARLPVEQLDFIAPLRPELKQMRRRIKRFSKRFKRAKSLVARAKRRAEVISGLAKRAGKLDKNSLYKLGEGRTVGSRREYRSKMSSQRVIANAHNQLSKAVKKAEEVLALMEDQLDPKEDGLRKAIDTLLRADAKTMLGKEIERQSGKRINWNHEMRMNDSIMYGYEAAPDYRKDWWLGRSRMAMDESQVDSAKMDMGARKAGESAARAEEAARTAVASIQKIVDELGEFRFRPKDIAKRPLDIPAVRYAKKQNRRRGKRRRRVQSRKLKIPRTFAVSNEEIIGSFDTRPAGY